MSTLDADARAFRREQRGVALGMMAALAISVGVTAAILTTHTGAEPPIGLRLATALRADLIVVACLAAAIANVARLRFVSPADIAGSAGGAASPEVRRAGAILQNTLEQAVLAMAAHLIAAATLPAAMRLVPALAGLFAAGRLLFWLGYRHGAPARAFGFALTFYPSVIALLVSAAAMLAR